MRTMSNIADITLVCPRNDLESATIIEVARKLGMDVRESRQGWGGRLGREPAENLRDLRRQVVIVELPDELAEEQLRRAGHDVVILDHHGYRGLTRWRPESSIEQFCQLIGHEMTPDLRAVAVNDKDFVPGLFRLGLHYSEMEAVRQRERKVLGTEALFQEARKYANEHRRPFKDLDLFLAPDRFKRAMGEAAQWPGEDKYERHRREGSPLQLPNCLVLYYTEDHQNDIVQVEYYGSKRLRPAFEDLLLDEELKEFEMWTGGGSRWMFLGRSTQTRGGRSRCAGGQGAVFCAD